MDELTTSVGKAVARVGKDVARMVREVTSQRPRRREVYRHYKGDFYVILGIATHTETEEELVVYRSLRSDSIWVRPLAMFMGSVDKDGQTVQRFQFVSER